MKKSLIIALALVFVLGIAGTAFAAANPFVDVPAKHWAYESVAKLAKAGIVDGYGDGTFRGDRTMTRYEMAVVVAKAMANSDKANAAQKAEIAKLEAEFSDELTKLGVRVSALENKVGNIKFTGEVRARYEYSKDITGGANNPFEKTRFRLAMEAPVAEGWTFKGRYAAENAPTTTAGASNTTATSVLDRAYLTGKAFGLNEFSLGRQQILLGEGMVSGRSTRYYDGLKIAFGGSDVKVQAATVKVDDKNTVLSSDRNFLMGDVKFQAAQNLNVTGTYFKDKSSANYKTWAAGLDYAGIQNILITGEYGKNSATNAKYNGSDSKAWYAQVKYMAANPKKVNTVGFWYGYSKADPNFDSYDLTSFDSISGAYGKMFNNKKGSQIGLEWTVFQNGVFSVIYDDWKTVDTETPNKNLTAQLVYTF